MPCDRLYLNSIPRSTLVKSVSVHAFPSSQELRPTLRAARFALILIASFAGSRSTWSSTYICQQNWSWRWLLKQAVCSAFPLALARVGKSIAARMAMMAITTSNSISVKAGRPDEGRLAPIPSAAQGCSSQASLRIVAQGAQNPNRVEDFPISCQTRRRYVQRKGVSRATVGLLVCGALCLRCRAEAAHLAIGGLHNDFGQTIAVQIGNGRHGQGGGALPLP